jgi:hypothetical protein
MKSIKLIERGRDVFKKFLKIKKMGRNKKERGDD